MGDWNFVSPVCKRDTKHTIGDPDVAYIPDLPNELVVEYILPFLLPACDLLLKAVPNDVSHMCNLRGCNRDWRWLILSTPKFASFCVVKHGLRNSKGSRCRG